MDKRIDVLAVALRSGLTVFDLEDLELSYAPPYGSAKDAINYAGFVAANSLRGDVRHCHSEEVLHPRDGQQLLDVRTSAELAAGTTPGAIHISLDDLRRRLGELPRDKEFLVFCQVGLRGYLACRILTQHGFQCRNLTGGHKTYAATTAAKPEKEPNEMKTDTGVDVPKPECLRPPTTPTRVVDATGLQCPGPIVRLKAELDTLPVGQAVAIEASDPAFAADVRAWCHSMGHDLVDVGPRNGFIRATIVKREARPHDATEPAATSKQKTIVVFSGDFDRSMASFIIANGAAAMGSQVTMFFTLWGLNVLRRDEAVKVKKTLVERVFGWMMPRGARRLTLSKMNMGGMGAAMIKGIMRKKHVASLPELIEGAKKAGVRLVACSMSMDLMGIKREELIDGVEEGGVAMYLDRAVAGNVNLFIWFMGLDR